MAGCSDVKKHAEAFAMCEYVLRHHPGFDFDSGVSHNVLNRENPDINPELEFEKPNDRYEVAEIYKGVSTFVEAEENENVRRLGKCIDDTSCDISSFEFRSPLLGMAVTKGGMVFSRMFDDLDSNTSVDKYTLVEIVRHVKNTQKNFLGKVSGGAKSFAYQRSMAVWVYDYITKPKSRGGFSVKYDSKQIDPEKNVVGTIKASSASCVEFTNLFISIGRKAGLDVRAVEIFYDSEGNGSRHVKPCVVFSNGKKLFFDLVDGHSFEEKEKWSFISDEDLSALDMMNRQGLNEDDNLDRVLEGKKNYVQLAYEMSPFHPPVLNAYFSYQINGGAKPGKAILHLTRALDENPFYGLTYYNLSVAYELLGDKRLADSYYGKYLKITGKEDHTQK